MSNDPERLLAEALRAQARYAPSSRPPRSATPAQQTPSADSGTSGHQRPSVPAVDLSGYGLLSGAGEESLTLRRAALDADERSAAVSTPPRGGHRRRTVTLPTHWVLILAASLGMAVGSVVGLLTLL